jgi:hypothetical protein
MRPRPPDEESRPHGIRAAPGTRHQRTGNSKIARTGRSSFRVTTPTGATIDIAPAPKPASLPTRTERERDLLKPKSRAFIAKILPALRRGHALSPKQRAWLQSLYEQAELLRRRR